MPCTSPRPDLRFLLVAGVAISVAAATPEGASAASEWRYDVTVKAQEVASWSYASRQDIGIPGDPCVVTRDARGARTTTFASAHPTRVLVMRGVGGRAPDLDVGTGDGIAIVGSSNVTGSDTTTHAGAGTCSSANPPQTQPTTDCGVRALRGRWTLAFRGARTVAPHATYDDARDACPTEPPFALTWSGATAPSLAVATTSVAASKFYGTKQFTVRGRRTFTGSSTGSGQGTETVTWQWATTYRRTSH